MKETGEALVPREYPATRRDGVSIVAEIASTIIDFEGAPAVLAYARDVTDRVRLRAKLAHTDRLASLGMMATGVAHEINNPLAFVGLAAEMLQRRVGADEEQLLQTVRGGIDRIASIVRDLRDFGRYDDEEPAGVVDLAQAIDAAERLVSHELRPRARLTKEYSELPAVVGVARRLEQVFVNLFLNAAVAVESRQEGTIAVSAQSIGENVVVSVRDNGVGIAPAELEAIFEPFVTTRANRGGTGLGLSICRDIVGRSGGSIVARSTQGEGTTMELTLVRAKPRPAAATIAKPPPEARPFASMSVLVIDYEPLLLAGLVSELSGCARVEGETSSERALRRLQDGDAFDAIVCDVMMPGLTGPELHERIARDKPALASRFVFMTGGAYATSAREYLSRVPNARLTKPFRTDELVRA
ncbi:MAG: hybrid sensor histidine kinase/response regulator, partial [Polyangiaceae bacterium]